MLDERYLDGICAKCALSEGIEDVDGMLKRGKGWNVSDFMHNDEKKSCESRIFL